MRIALVALLFSCLVLSGCGRTIETMSYGGNSVVFGELNNGLPNCVGSNSARWHECNGVVRSDYYDVVGTPDETIYINSSPYRNGKMHGQGLVSNWRTNELCEVTYVNGVPDGWMTCRNMLGNKAETKKFFENGRESPEKVQELAKQNLKDECEELGFTPKTPEFGNCVLKLRELAQGAKPTTVIQSEPVRTAPTTADKIEGTKQILEAIQGVTTPAQSTGKQIDLRCVNVCQAEGKSLMYCRSDCAY